ncbi:hypothetical protein K788_0002800 [Paraburkholderia caribensis MBA4]|uniref:Uncharacterized protein n=1 Tax=Paraburkholderia caribensis MBA4 TaxID=1323664 RepID=A0A0P0RD79_9BURK|nr:hypothetical protein K788_0002800 [Paraburkholderia caribensis MBA4]
MAACQDVVRVGPTRRGHQGASSSGNSASGFTVNARCAHLTRLSGRRA